MKIKWTKTAEFVVTGFDPDGRNGVRSLNIAELIGKKLTLAGSVGSGLTQEISRELRRRIDAGERVVVTVEHRGRTTSGGLLHPALKVGKFR